MAKINSKIDQALRKDVIENGVFLGTVLIFGFNDNIYLYENEVYVEQFKLTDDDYVVTDFYQGSWEVINTNINSGKFNANEPYAEALIDYMSLYNRSLYLSNKKYREIAKEQFAELKKDYQESGLLDDINALLKKSKSKTFRYSTFESLKENRFDDLKRDIETLLLDDKVLKSLEDIDDNLELAYMLAERLDPSDYSMNSEDDLADEIKDMIVRGKIKITESKKSDIKKLSLSIKESTNIFDTLENAWDKTTMNNNVFEKTVLKLKTDSFKDPFNKYSTIYMFADGSSIDCDGLDPFDCDWCTYVSEDLSFVHEFKK